jgi:signal transduction histidine kinase
VKNRENKIYSETYKEIFNEEVFSTYFKNAFRLGWAAIAGCVVLIFLRTKMEYPHSGLFIFNEILIFLSSLFLDLMATKYIHLMKRNKDFWLKVNLVVRYFLYISLSIYLTQHLIISQHSGWISLVVMGVLAGGIESVSATGFAIPRFSFFLIISFVISPTLYFMSKTPELYYAPAILLLFYSLNQFPKIRTRFSEFIEKIEAKEKLIIKNKQLEEFIDFFPGDIAWLTKDKKYIRINKSLGEKLRQNPNDIIGKEFGFTGTFEDIKKTIDAFIQSPLISDEHLIEHTEVTGTVHRLQLYLKKFNENSDIILLGVNVEKQYALQQENLDLLKKMEMITFASKFGFFFEDVELNKLTITDQLVEITGLPRLISFENAGEIFRKRILPEYQVEISKKIDDFYSGKVLNLNESFKFYKESNTIIWLNLFMMAEKRDSFSPRPLKIIGYHRDITEQKELELKIAQSTKLESIGLMASGLAHEINNPLTIISFLVQRMKKNVQVENLQNDLLKIEETVKRISKIINNLKVFSRDSNEDPFEKVLLKDLIDDVVFFTHNRLENAKVLLRINSYDQNVMIFCQRVALSQVFINLINNSMDAIEQLDERWINLEITSENDVLRIKIIDSGTGIPDEVADKMMSPFFTTKEAGKGTGLGLSICLGIIKKHNGHFSIVKGEVNTTFFIGIPL